MDPIDIVTVKKRAVKAVLTLASGTFLIQIITISSQFFITILFPPAVFGVFTILNAGVLILTYFSDIGLAAALIQKKEELTYADLQTTFTIQQILVVTLVILGLLFSNQVADFYHLDTNGLWLFRSIIVSFFLASLKTIPTILLERSIQFTKIAYVSILETIVFYLTIIFFALQNYTLESFSYAVLFRGIVGLILMYFLSPWKMSLGFSKNAAQKLFSFGIPMQLNSLIALVKDNLFLLYLGKVLTHTQVGYYGWAKSYSEAPLRLVMDSLSKIMFPVYSRLQDDKKELQNIIEKSLFFQSLLIFPLSVGFVFLIEPIVGLIPRYEKWEPAIPLFYLFVLTSILASISIPLTHVLNATGQVKKTLNIMIFLTILTWTITPFAISLYGFIGVGIAAIVVAFSQLITIYVVKKFLPFSLVRSFFAPVLGTAVMGIGLYFLKSFLPVSVFGITSMILIGAILYIVSIVLFDLKNLKEDIKFVLTIFKKT